MSGVSLTPGTQVDVVRLTPGLSGEVGMRADNPTQNGSQREHEHVGVRSDLRHGDGRRLEDFQMHDNDQPPMLIGTEQMDARSFGNNAEIQNPGAALNYVFSSGGNQLRGRVAALVMDRELYRRRDLNGDRNYNPREMNVDLNAPDFVSITSVANAKPLDSTLTLPHSHEAAVTLEHELLPNMGARLLYICKRRADEYTTVNAARPYRRRYHDAQHP